MVQLFLHFQRQMTNKDVLFDFTTHLVEKIKEKMLEATLKQNTMFLRLDIDCKIIKSMN